jgi:hypothetical protein
MADRFEERADELVELLGLENGKAYEQDGSRSRLRPRH